MGRTLSHMNWRCWSGEEGLGRFDDILLFQREVEMEKLTAKLEAGLVQIRLPKRGLSAAKTGTVRCSDTDRWSGRCTGEGQ
jgi:hypothetical protein